MEENKNTTTAAVEETIDSIKKLMDAIGNDDDLKEKLEGTLAALTGNTAASNEEQAAENASEKTVVARNGDEKSDEEEENDDEEGASYSSDTDLSDIFNEDAIAGMVVGFIAGAAVVGGGVLLHKMLK